MPTQFRSGGLQPRGAGGSVQERRIGPNPLYSQLIRLTESLDPEGQGPMAKLLAEREAAAKRAAEIVFNQDRQADEAAVIQTFPQFRGGTQIIGRHLDHLRGQQAAVEVGRQLLIDYTAKGMEGQPPEVIQQFFDQGIEEGFKGRSLSEDGTASFYTDIAKFRGQLESGALDEHIKRINQEHVNQEGQTARAFVTAAAAEDDYSTLGENFVQSIDAGRAIGRTVEEQANTWLNEIGIVEKSNPNMNGDAYREILKAQVFDEDVFVATGERRLRYAVRDSKVRAALDDAADAADVKVQKAEEARSKQTSLTLRQQEKEMKGTISGLVRQGRSKEDIISQMQDEIDKAPLEIQAKVTDYLVAATKDRDVFAQRPLAEIARLRSKIYTGQLDEDGLVAEDLPSDQYKALLADVEAFRKGKGVAGTDSFNASLRRLENQKIKQGPGDDPAVKAYWARNDLIDGLKERFRRDAIMLSAFDPDLLQNPVALSEKLSTLTEAYLAEIEEVHPRDRTRDPEMLLGREAPALPEDHEKKRELIRLKIMRDARDEYRALHAQAVATGYVSPEPSPGGESAFLSDDADSLTELYLRTFDSIHSNPQ